MVRVLSDTDVARVLALDDVLPVVADAFVAQYRGEVERPDRPHYPVGFAPGDRENAAGTALAMPAYVHGSDVYATKLVGVHDANAERDLPTVNAQIALTDAETGMPQAFLHGTRITNARTGCIGGLAARELADGPLAVGVVGAGTQARWQVRAIAATSDVERVRVYSPSESREACAADLQSELGVPVDPARSARNVVADADVVVTATTSTNPVFPADALADDALVVAVGAYSAETRELSPAVFERAGRVFADVPEEVAAIGDLRDTGLTAADLVPLAALFAGDETGMSGLQVVESVGSAVLDAATAAHVLDAAREAAVGTTVTF